MDWVLNAVIDDEIDAVWEVSLAERGFYESIVNHIETSLDHMHLYCIQGINCR